MSGAYWNELDFEKLGADCHLQTNAIFGAPSAEHPQTNNNAGDLCGSYHTYAFEWTPSYISWQIDGAEIRRDTGATATAFSQNASAGMQIHLNVWPGDASFGGNFDPSILPVSEFISWLQYSSYSNGAFTVTWRQDFDAANVPTGWATGNWASPKNYSTHSPANVTFENGIAILSLTNDDATGFKGTPPSDGNAAGSGSVGGSGNSGGNPSAGGGGAPSAGNGGVNSSAGTGTNAGGMSSALGGAAGISGGIGLPSAGTGGGIGATGGSAGAPPVDRREGDNTNGATNSAGGQQAEPASACSCELPPTRRTSSPASVLALAAAASFIARRRRAKHRR
jgi:hypothetical protein